MIRRPPRSTQSSSSAASDVYKRQAQDPRLLSQYAAGAPQLHGQGRVKHVGGSHAKVDVLGGVSHMLRNVRQECYYVVVGGFLSLLHALHVKSRSLTNIRQGFVRDLSQLRPSFTHRQFHLQPGGHLGLFRPHSDHFWCGVPFNQSLNPPLPYPHRPSNQPTSRDESSWPPERLHSAHH